MKARPMVPPAKDSEAIAVERRMRDSRASVDLDSAIAVLHEVKICGASTGHVYSTIIMCDSEARAQIVARALRAFLPKT